jgi:hypothetical protein
MHVALVEPSYYTRYPPLGLLKLSAFHKKRGDTVELLKGTREPVKQPDQVYVTSLFTYAWKPVHESVKFFKSLFPSAPLTLGGIYASLLPDHARLSGADKVHVGLFKDAEELLPDYSLVPRWKRSILFSSRGCVRKCGFCAVPELEGGINSIKSTIKNLIYPGHTGVVLWDNNILGAPNWQQVFRELHELGLNVDFNQGLDARLITEEVGKQIRALRIRVVRLAYDYIENELFLEKAIRLLNEAGIRGRDILVYTLYNYKDSPEDFFQRVKSLLDWGVVSYPMRYEPPTSLEKNHHVGSCWSREELEMVSDAQRVLGNMGAFPPYEGLRRKFCEAVSFHEAFELRPRKKREPRCEGDSLNPVRQEEPVIVGAATPSLL